MKSYENRTLQELVGMSSDEDVLGRILGILEEEHHRKMEKTRGNPESQCLTFP